MDIQCNILPNGDLELIADLDCREYIEQRSAMGRSYWSIMADIFESYSCNGSFAPFDAGQGNPFVGLTSAPCIAESLSYLDNGDREIDGRFWYFADYQTCDDLEELRDAGRLVYTLARGE